MCVFFLVLLFAFPMFHIAGSVWISLEVPNGHLSREG